jgi:translation initiation factor IF-1
MPRNLKGGNKAKKKSNKSLSVRNRKDIPLPEEDENSHIAKVTSVLGDCRFNIEILSDTGIKKELMISHLPRSSRRFGRVVIGSIVKVSKRDFENKCDILYTYDPSEVDYLVSSNYIDKDNESSTEEGGISFTNEVIEDELDISMI